MRVFIRAKFFFLQSPLQTWSKRLPQVQGSLPVGLYTTTRASEALFLLLLLLPSVSHLTDSSWTFPFSQTFPSHKNCKPHLSVVQRHQVFLVNPESLAPHVRHFLNPTIVLLSVPSIVCFKTWTTQLHLKPFFLNPNFFGLIGYFTNYFQPCFIYESFSLRLGAMVLPNYTTTFLSLLLALLCHHGFLDSPLSLGLLM